ncbi:Peptidase family M50 [Pirellula sp. SH-Sr6A]|uniref:site-2 protease family protein n=1 Tax=Pirellula sp. SH-Sr6A TaxID=1632865 RepID=UPI00078D38C3|nr:site-2 protease family protein [Pirellula sp. SH-Sr6A]AMV33472.1 Peptidase family M50 [Pirellula sp. SH-Sr6A]
MSLVLGNSPALLSAMDRPIPLRRRLDLIVRQSVGREGVRFTIKDPVAFQHFQYLHEEYFLLACLDGRTSRRELQSRFEKQFPGKRLSIPHLERLLANFFYEGLVLADRPGTGERLYARSLKNKKLSPASLIQKLLCIRFRGFSFPHVLDEVERRTRFLLHPVSIVLFALFLVFTVGFAAIHREAFQDRLPAWNEYLSLRYVSLLILAIAIAKILHELSHAMVCRRFGAECNEIGVMLLLFVPCLYCEVSDSWMLKSRWKRAAVAGAGIAAECVLGGLAFWCWWLTYPGVIHAISLQVMIVCSINSILINGQPLLRYDGYFVLSDALNRPNLWTASRAHVRRLFGMFFLKPAFQQRDPWMRSGTLALWFGLASSVYQFAVLAAMLWVLHALAIQWRLLSVFWMVLFLIGGTIVLVTSLQLGSQIQNPSFRRRLSLARSLGTAAAIVVGIVLLFTFPVSWNATSFGIVLPEQRQPILSIVAGRLASCVEAGQYVRQGEVIATLENPTLELERSNLQVQLQQARARQESLRRKRAFEPSASQSLLSAEQQVLGLEQELALLDKNLELLTLRADRAGWCVEPDRGAMEESQTQAWRVPLLSFQNLGCHIVRGTWVATVENAPVEQIPLEQATVEQQGGSVFRAYFRESDVAGIQSGQDAKVILRRQPDRPCAGVVRQVKLDTTGEIPPALQRESLFSWYATTEGTKSKEPVYLVEIELKVEIRSIDADGIGRVWVTTSPLPLAAILWRSLASNLRW